jgi:hypothetical protein
MQQLETRRTVSGARHSEALTLESCAKGDRVRLVVLDNKDADRSSQRAAAWFGRGRIPLRDTPGRSNCPVIGRNPWLFMSESGDRYGTPVAVHDIG